MIIREYRKQFISALSTHYDAMEAENFFHLLLASDRQLTQVDLALNPKLSVDDIEVGRWNDIADKLKLGFPIQYLLGKTYFCGLEFTVRAGVLIPRPETEELVEWIVSDNARKSGIAVLDIGTGSGCIAISLAKQLKSASISAIDVSPDALQIATKNAIDLNADVNFKLVDILTLKSLGGIYDIIVSNPPYVRNLEKHEIRNNVLDHEPHLALFVDDLDPLLFYRKIANLAKASLSESGKLYFEINQYLGNETVSLLAEIGYRNIDLRKDIYGNDRMISATL